MKKGGCVREPPRRWKDREANDIRLVLVCRQAAVFCQLAGDRGQPMIDGLLEASDRLEDLCGLRFKQR